MRPFKTLLRQHASPVFIGWYMRMAGSDIRVDPTPVMFAMLNGPTLTLDEKADNNVQ